MRIAMVVPYFTTTIPTSEYWESFYLRKLGHEVSVFTTSFLPPRGGRLAWSDVPVRVSTFRSVNVLPDSPLPLGLPRLGEHFEVLWLQEDYPFFNQGFFVANQALPLMMTTERYCYPRNPLKSAVVRVLDVSTLSALRRKCCLITTHSNASKSFMHGLGVAQAKLRVIPNGVNTQIFKPYQSRFLHNYLGIPEHSRIILTIGRLSASKGLQILLNATSGLLKKSNDIHLVLVGRGPEEERLRELSLLLGVSEQVHIVTALFLPYERVPDLYNSAEICVNPSLSEPFGMTALEAQSCGKAVICSNTGGLSDIVLDDVTGRLVPPGSQEALHAALGELLQEDLSRFESEARKRTIRSFDWNRISQSYADSLVSCVESFS